MNWLDRRIDNFIRRIRDNPNTKKIPIGPNPDDPTYWRYFVIRRNRFLNLYLHNFRQDDEEHLHDHRMLNISFPLQGDYFEERFVCKPTPGYPLPDTRRIPVRNRRPFIRLPSTPHRVVLRRDDAGNPLAMWSLFIGFPHTRDWGFWCPGKPRTPERSSQCHWVPWQQYVTPESHPENVGYGQAGQGCGE